MRIAFVVALVLVNSALVAKGPTLKLLIAQTSCTDTVCMNDFANRYDLCWAGAGKGDPIWWSCDAMASGDSVRMALGGTLMFFKKPKADGSTAYGYGIATCDPKYAAKLNKELERLRLTESRRSPDGGIVYGDPNDPSLQIMRQEGSVPANDREMPLWMYIVKKEVH